MTIIRALYAAETALEDLRTAELVILAALRFWTVQEVTDTTACNVPYAMPAQLSGVGKIHVSRAAPPAEWQRMLNAAQLDAAGQAGFDGLMRTIRATARRVISVRCPCAARMSADEALLLQCVGDLQHGRPQQSGLALLQWLPPAAARIAGASLTAFAVSLARCGLVVPKRHCEAAGIALLADGGDRGLSLLQ